MVCWPRKSPGVSTAAASTRRSPSSLRAAGSRRGRRWRCTCGSASRPACRAGSRCTRCACRRGRTSIRNTSVNPEPLTPGASPGSTANHDPETPGSRPGSVPTDTDRQPGGRRGRMLVESAVVEEMPVWLEVNGEPAVTWMCTPDQLEELATGWLHGEGYIESLDDLVKLRPCAPDLGFWAEVKPERVAAVKGENRKRVLASGCGAVSTFLADPHQVAHAPARGEPPAPERLRALFKDLFGRGERYNETGGIHAAALTDDERLLFHAEDIGRHNAVDKVVGAAVLARVPITGRGLRVTARIAAALRDILGTASTIAVVGLAPRPARTSHAVARYLQGAGYRIVPVNPGHATILGEQSYPTLTAAAADQAIDVVDVFRRSKYVGTIVDEAIGVDPPPRLIWLQVGVVDDAARARAQAAGIPCVMDRCLMVDHRALGV